MRDPNRIDEVIEQMRGLWKENPDMRLGQLVMNIQHYMNGNKHDTNAMWNAEEDKWLLGIERMKK